MTADRTVALADVKRPTFPFFSILDYRRTPIRQHYGWVAVLMATFLLTAPNAVCGFAVSLGTGQFGTPIEPGKVHDVTLRRVPRADSEVVLRISETNGDFNNADETISLMLGGTSLLGPTPFSSANHDILTTLTLDEMVIPPQQFNDLLTQGKLQLEIATSRRVDQSYGAFFNPSETIKSYFDITLEYIAVPEPASGISCWWGWTAILLLSRRWMSTSTIALH